MKFALFGSYGRDNIGDEAIADGIHKMLQEIIPSAEITLFTHNIETAATLHPQFSAIKPVIATGLRSLFRQWQSGVWKENIRTLQECDYIIVGGGGIFHDYETEQKGINPLFIWWLRVLIFALLKKPILIWAVGIGPIHKSFSHFWLKGILKRAHTITVRDQDSALLVHNVQHTATIVPDPVWGLFQNQSKTKDPTLTINIRPNQRIPSLQIKKLLYEKISSLQTQYQFQKIQFIPFALKQPDDRELMNEFVKELGDRFHIPVTIVSPQSPLEAFTLIAKSTAMIAMRFHSYIFAQSAQCPCILLSYSAKTDAIAQQTLLKNLALQKQAQVFWLQILSTKH